MKNSPKKKLTPIPKLLKKAQDKYNAHIRERDKNFGCISCGAEVQQAGHYHSQGQHSGLRFGLPDSLAYYNTNGQCIRCNMFLSGNLIRYRYGLVARYGEEFVKELEEYALDNPLKKWTRSELEEIINYYK